MSTADIYIQHTRQWIQQVVIGLNLCPFAAKPVKENKVRFFVEETASMAVCLDTLANECRLLDHDPSVETTLLILPHCATHFDDFLHLLDLSERRLRKLKYEGIYQVASFHPDYCFAGEAEHDAANYTNRSPYPMLHLLREDSLEEAIRHHPDPEGIPERNIRLTREKGEAYMRLLREASMG